MRYLFILIIFCCSCKNKKTETQVGTIDSANLVAEKHVEEKDSFIAIPLIYDSAFVDLASLSDDFVFELKYATPENFLNEPVYDCGKCFLRYKVAKSLIEANKVFMEKGYKIKLFDCYRLLHVQKKMWAMFPDARYVANPYTSSSYHNRGCAVDLTLTDLEGNELDMGTPFDFFGRESHYAYPGVSEEVRLNRALLREVLESAGFKGIRTEWWHFSKYKYPVSDEIMCKDGKEIK